MSPRSTWDVCRRLISRRESRVEDAWPDCPGPRWVGARTSILSTVVASVAAWVVAAAGSLFSVLLSAPVGVQGLTCVTARVEPPLYWGYGEPPAVAWRLLDRHIPVVPSQKRVLASIKPESLRQRAFCLLHHRMLDQCVDFMMGLMAIRRCELREPS